MGPSYLIAGFGNCCNGNEAWIGGPIRSSAPRIVGANVG
jgi:hypothetical protein